MYEIIEGIHKALRIESTWQFVGVVALAFAVVGGILGLIVDLGYKNSREYKLEHGQGNSATAVSTPSIPAPTQSAATKASARKADTSPKPNNPPQGQTNDGGSQNRQQGAGAAKKTNAVEKHYKLVKDLTDAEHAKLRKLTLQLLAEWNERHGNPPGTPPPASAEWWEFRESETKNRGNIDYRPRPSYMPTEFCIYSKR